MLLLLPPPPVGTHGCPASVTHLLRQLVRVEDAGHRHLQLVLLLLGLAQSRLPLLQEQVRRVLAGKLLRDKAPALGLRVRTRRLARALATCKLAET